MSKPTEQEIAATIAHFRDIAPKIVQKTFFGDSNRDKIDAQIEVMEDGLGDTRIYDLFENPEDEDDRATLDAALDARRWLDGEYDDCDGPFSQSWDSLVNP